MLGCSGGGEMQAAGSTLALTLGETWRMMPQTNSCCRTLLGAKTEARSWRGQDGGLEVNEEPAAMIQVGPLRSASPFSIPLCLHPSQLR